MRRSKGRSRCKPVNINGWECFAHPMLLDQLERLIGAVQREKAKAPTTYQSGANAKLLAALAKLMFETVPSDPTRPEYRQGGTLGAARKHWFRAKFGGQRFRLFYRYDTGSKVIIYAWVNDAQSLRTYASRTDAYAVFRSMLEKGNPPDSWPALMEAAKAGTKRLSKAAEALAIKASDQAPITSKAGGLQVGRAARSRPKSPRQR